MYICDYADDHLETHVRELKSLYPSCEVHARQFDATDEKAVEGVVKEAVRTYGRLDVFFANAGIVGPPSLFTDIEVKDFEHTMKTNVTR